MDYYQTSFYALVVLCLGLLASQPTRRKELEQKAEVQKKLPRNDKHPERFWDEHGLSAGLVSSLFTTGFMSSALSGYFVGALSDRHGRRLLCLIYCLLYALSCIFTIIPSVPLLFLGRVLGGISTSILFSVFDSWMVTNFRERKLVKFGCDLSRTYATTSTVNSLAAILGGVASEVSVRVTGTKKAPFMLSAVLLWSALQVMWSHWVSKRTI
ncbi:hypothetical protein F4810DRAFT_716782 [Camillea tinctor]|nr:hypothetical protein F4810DRAFT_716782 [Camillea tinctor]